MKTRISALLLAMSIPFCLMGFKLDASDLPDEDQITLPDDQVPELNTGSDPTGPDAEDLEPAPEDDGDAPLAPPDVQPDTETPEEESAPDPDSERLEELRINVRQWAESDPETAAQWAEAILEDESRAAALEQIAVAWAGKDLLAASRWVATLPEGVGRATAASAVGYEAARTNPMLSLRLAELLAIGQERSLLTAHAISQWAMIDRTAADQWVQNVPDPELRARLVASEAVASADEDPVSAATLVANGMEPGVEQSTAAIAVMQRWAQHAPREAGAWVLQFQEPETRAVAGEVLVSLWTVADRVAALDWARTLTEEAFRDACENAYLDAVAHGDDSEPADP